MRISDWSLDVCSSDLLGHMLGFAHAILPGPARDLAFEIIARLAVIAQPRADEIGAVQRRQRIAHRRSEEHTSELQSLMRISYAVFCLKKKKKNTNNTKYTYT